MVHIIVCSLESITVLFLHWNKIVLTFLLLLFLCKLINELCFIYPLVRDLLS